MKATRLDKFLSDNTEFSRSELKKLIHSGKASVNGETVTIPDFKIDTDTDNIVFCGKTVENKRFVYLLMNKPAGVLSAANDKSRQTVVDLVPEEFKHYDLFPVGRLDKDTTGLLMITNNGDYAHRVISPKYKIEKTYIADVDSVLPADLPEKFSEGIVLADGYRCEPAKAEILSENRIKITVYEGKYHQIKRMLGVCGLGVNKLHRERVGGIVLPENMNFGQTVELTENEAFRVFF
ncbi:MAG: rRNA pseudouridine synthase [Clostridiales bacterium]|nr:rRNA pseudouridine synthase [Candidatus Equinaster intestinalis]